MPECEWAKEFYSRTDEGACPVCNLYYVQELGSDRRLHRPFDNNVVSIFDHKPNARLAAKFCTHGECVPVSALSAHYPYLLGFSLPL